jgi:hypothetical protein
MKFGVSVKSLTDFAEISPLLWRSTRKPEDVVDDSKRF